MKTTSLALVFSLVALAHGISLRSESATTLYAQSLQVADAANTPSELSRLARNSALVSRVTVHPNANCPSVRSTSQAPSRFDIHSYYTKYIEAVGGIPVIASSKVQDAAVIRTAMILNKMFARVQDIARFIADGGVMVRVISLQETITSLPDLDIVRPESQRGMGGFATVVPEENILCYEDSDLFGSISVHEFLHMMHLEGIDKMPKYSSVRDMIVASYCARNVNEFKYKFNEYADTNADEFFAETAMWYLDADFRFESQNIHPNRGREYAKARVPCMVPSLASMFGTTTNTGVFRCPDGMRSGTMDCTNFWQGSVARNWNTYPRNTSAKFTRRVVKTCSTTAASCANPGFQPKCHGPFFANDGCCFNLGYSEGKTCEVGQGGCVTDSQCSGALKCGRGKCKSVYGYGSVSMGCCYDASNPHAPAVTNPNTTPTTPVTPTTPTKDCGKGMDFACCTPEDPCDENEGDCDDDNECKGYLVCGTDNCPSPLFTHHQMDCCRKPERPSERCKSGGDWACCSFANKCGVGAGDCDNDEECDGSLRCGVDNCSFGPSTLDCCYAPKNCKTGTDWACCTKQEPCGVGEGDCDSDAECKNGLKCGSNNCAFGHAQKDCCYQPS